LAIIAIHNKYEKNPLPNTLNKQKAS